MGMILPIMLSYQNYKEHELEQIVKRKNKELRENAENTKKKYGYKYIWVTQYPNFAKHYHIL
tara:strand:+ start:43 stop:228 length:186 start_codon:yes stop_codon:yes gene_type:complete